MKRIVSACIEAAKPMAEHQRLAELAGPQQPTGQEHFVWTKPTEREHALTLWFLMNDKGVRVAETRFARGWS